MCYVEVPRLSEIEKIAFPEITREDNLNLFLRLYEYLLYFNGKY